MKSLSLISAVSALLFTTLAGEAEAAWRPPVNPQSCRALATQVGSRNVWQTVFYGEREGFFDWQRDSLRRSPCFKTQAACKAWLYSAQTYYWEMMQFQPCRRGGY